MAGLILLLTGLLPLLEAVSVYCRGIGKAPTL